MRKAAPALAILAAASYAPPGRGEDAAGIEPPRERGEQSQVGGKEPGHVSVKGARLELGGELLVQLKVKF